MRVYGGIVEEGVYLPLQIASNIASILCGQERWKEKNSTGLLIYHEPPLQRVDWPPWLSQ